MGPVSQQAWHDKDPRYSKVANADKGLKFPNFIDNDDVSI
jgi:hypothetical protein